MTTGRAETSLANIQDILRKISKNSLDLETGLCYIQNELNDYFNREFKASDPDPFN
jgi:hypothetical protein